MTAERCSACTNERVPRASALPPSGWCWSCEDAFRGRSKHQTIIIIALTLLAMGALVVVGISTEQDLASWRTIFLTVWGGSMIALFIRARVRRARFIRDRRSSPRATVVQKRERERDIE
jgi:hypothetical protein